MSSGRSSGWRNRIDRYGFIGRGQVFIAIAIACVGVFVWIAFELGQIRAGHNAIEARQRYGELAATLAEERAEIQRLHERVTQLETDSKIDAEGCRRVESDLVSLQTEILTQQEDLEFYRGIVSDQQAGLRVQDFMLWRGERPLSYSMRLVLAQAMRADRRVSGTVELMVEGELDGKLTTLSLRELGEKGRRPDRLDFSFRYFQNLETVLIIPEGFAPARVTVKLTPKGTADKPVERSFDWTLKTG